MAFVEINPRYQALLGRQGLSRFEQFLSLPAVIVGGHPERNVARVILGSGSEAVRAFLKREHRVRWRDRLRNAWAGFGLASKSYREAQALRALQRAGIGCPDWIAVGEDRRGQAFLLVQELDGAIGLRQFLHEHASFPAERRDVVRRLGQALARVHEAGFDHPDLYSKHVLIDPLDRAVYFVDWQRSRSHAVVTWARRSRDLAALDATLPDGLAPPTDRMACLHAYLLEANEKGATIPGLRVLRTLADDVRLQAGRLLQKRHVREARSSSLPAGVQEVIWLDGEALCVTPSFWSDLDGRVPDWLRLDGATRGTGRVTQSVVLLPRGRQGLLVRRRENGLLRWLWQGLRRRPVVSPELRRAGELFRLQRNGIGAPRLLAFGQRRPLPWRTESFLLIEIEAADPGRGA